MTSRKMKLHTKKAFRKQKVGITIDQWVILKKLYEQDDLSQTELASSVHKDTPTVTRMIDLLCEKNLTERRPDQSDRRKFSIFLTREGKKKVEELLPLIIEIRMKGWEGLNEQDFGHLKRILNKVAANFNEEP